MQPDSHGPSLAPIAPPRTVVSVSEVPNLEIAVFTRDARQATVQASGEIDLATAPLLAAILDDQLRHGRWFLRLDLSRATFLDCAGLRTIEDAHHACSATQGALVLTGIGTTTARILKITRLDQKLRIEGPDETARNISRNPRQKVLGNRRHEAASALSSKAR